MAVVITLTNQKGGVGKTTTANALACGLAVGHKKVLAIDLDPQGNLGFSLGLDIDSSRTIYEVLQGRISLQKAIQRTEFCDVVASNILLSSPEILFTSPGRELLLKNTLESVQDFYDFIIIDTPPALNLLTANAYAASDYLIIPMIPEILSLMGVSQLKETIDSVTASFNPALRVLGILLTRFTGRTLLSREVLEMAQSIASQMGTQVFSSRIRPGISAAEAPAHGMSIYKYAPRSNPARDYRQFVSEVLRQL